jgi:hypothetical protein
VRPVGALRELTWGRRKSADDAVAGTEEEGFTLKRELTALDVTVLGIGVIMGAGIFVYGIYSRRRSRLA